MKRGATKQKMCAGIPNWNYDDSYMIEYALENDCFIVSNDKFNDNVAEFKKSHRTSSNYYENKLKNMCIK